MTAVEKDITDNEIKEIRPKSVRRALKDYVPKSLQLETYTPSETSPRYVQDTVQLITDINPKAVNPTMIVFDGSRHKPRAQIFGGCIRRDLLRIGMSFQFCINETDGESTIFILPEDYETVS